MGKVFTAYKLKYKDKTKHLKQPIYLSMFSKLILAFVLVGLFPVVITGQIMYQRLAVNVEEIVSSHASQIAYNFGINVENLIENYDETSRYLYDYTSDKYVFLSELLKDEEVSSLEKETEINSMLFTILYTSSYIENIRFVTPDNEVYHVSRDITRLINKRSVMENQWKYKKDNPRILYIMPSYSDKLFYYNDEDMVITIGRNYMDVSTVQSAQDTVLGTLYMDINPKQISILEKGIGLGERSTIAIYDKEEGICVYSSENDKIGIQNEKMKELIESFEGDYGTYRSKEAMYAYYQIENSGWEVVARLDQTDINETYVENSKYFILILLGISFLLSVVYYMISQQITKPARVLKNAMEKIKEGDLNTRVSISTHDEMEVLGKGLNEMADNLQIYIKKIYVAELKQKDAELEALRTTIKPHYLYNTLEVIRMSAITKEDMLVADMIGSLSQQLQYLVGHKGELVTLKEEIQNIRDYFYIVQIRYENRFELEVEVDVECRQLYVLKLFLQPIVENAVKHGLKPKEGVGKVSISARVEEDILWVTVMDDGVGMEEEQVERIMNALKESVSHQEDALKKSSIGLKNVYERIVINYGANYGFSLVSMKELGTIVKIKLPVIKERGGKNEGINC